MSSSVQLLAPPSRRAARGVLKFGSSVHACIRGHEDTQMHATAHDRVAYGRWCAVIGRSAATAVYWSERRE
eukprot:2883169-Prymnesium_polylepis.1